MSINQEPLVPSNKPELPQGHNTESSRFGLGKNLNDKSTSNGSQSKFGSGLRRWVSLLGSLLESKNALPGSYGAGAHQDTTRKMGAKNDSVFKEGETAKYRGLIDKAFLKDSKFKQQLMKDPKLRLKGSKEVEEEVKKIKEEAVPKSLGSGLIRAKQIEAALKKDAHSVQEYISKTEKTPKGWHDIDKRKEEYKIAIERVFGANKKLK